MSLQMIFGIKLEHHTINARLVGLKVNTHKTKCTLISHHQSTGQYHDVKTGNKCFENIEKLKYLEMTATN
jgi:hypothetical protein